MEEVIYFFGDGLDSAPYITDDMTTERRDETTEQAKKLRPASFDLVLTNPPFSMSYNSSNEDEQRILEQRGIASGHKSVKSNLLFLDRYHELLKPSGEILIVIDDTVLNGKTHLSARKWILNRFILLGIHSLPFNAFFKAKANIKTSVIHLKKKQSEEESQGHIFMSITNNIGHDSRSNDTIERNNLVDVLMTFFEWKRTGKLEQSIRHNQDRYETLECPQQIWLLPPDNLKAERFDAFFYAPDLENIRKEMMTREVCGEIQIHRGRSDFRKSPKIVAEDRVELSTKELKYIEIGDVTPYGLIVQHIEGVLSDLPSRGRYKIQAGDVLMAINNSSRGTVVLVPKEYDGAICTSGFLVVVCRDLFGWYNTEHYHSGIGLLTPESVHYGRAATIVEGRKQVLLDFFGAHPERFVKGTPKPPEIPLSGVDQSTTTKTTHQMGAQATSETSDDLQVPLICTIYGDPVVSDSVRSVTRRQQNHAELRETRRDGSAAPRRPWGRFTDGDT